MKKNKKWYFSAYHIKQHIAFGIDWCYTKKDGLTEIDFYFLCWGFGWVKCS